MWQAAGAALLGVAAAGAVAAGGRQKKVKQRRARVLKPGQLSLIVYGQDERLLWLQRVSSFLADARWVAWWPDCLTGCGWA
jgi:hypothetical protein